MDTTKILSEKNTYKIMRHYALTLHKKFISSSLSFDDAKAHCNDIESSSNTCTLTKNRAHTLAYGPWFDGFYQE
jgi:hypothetical protein